MLATFETVECGFIDRRRAAPNLHSAIAVAFDGFPTAAAEPAAPSLIRAGRSIASTMDAAAARRGEPAYHDRHHAAEATLSMALL